MPVPETTEEEAARWDDSRLSWDMEGLFWDGPVPEAVRNLTTVMADPNTKPMSPAMLQEDKKAIHDIVVFLSPHRGPKLQRINAASKPAA
ncbi:MAG: hypothetical protein NTX35_05050 [Verrucomicrobia bacterium]|nr:hypothetical protein [Verrucomicrobiota bacterium]